jgi:serine kinase of HPr protein (carbohydrate metabolism regulator)
MKLQVIIDKLALNVLTVVEDKDISGVFISDMLSDVMSNAQSGNLWITVQSHKNIVSAANLIDVSAVIVTHNKKVPEDTIELANRYHVVILSTPLSAFELASKLFEAGIK